MKAMILTFLMAFSCIASANTETRCGWISNPTPGNFWIDDADGSWTMGTQGGFQAHGLETLEYPANEQYVETNGSYGYFCGCVTGATDSENMLILSVVSAKAQLLKVCLKDENLPRNF